MNATPEGLKGLRLPFPPEQISKLPKPTKAQTEAVKTDYKAGARCEICGTWHHPRVVHLDYVGHAALTSRLLDVDPLWTWEPLAFNDKGLPALDEGGGLWIKLTVCGVTRFGYGDAQGKAGPDAMKERIGDALRNAAMRFGAALDLWHKGDVPLFDGEDHSESTAVRPPQRKTEQPHIEGESTRVHDDPMAQARADAAAQGAPALPKAKPVNGSALASAGEIAHIKGKFNGRLDEACKECGLSLTAATIDQMTSDQFVVLMDKKKEWRL